MRNALAQRRSRELRRAMSPIEQRLWYRINRRQLDGVKFRRQVPIGPFIADFASHEAKLVIELDGDTHFTDEALRYDVRRTAILEAHGFRVIRFGNSAVHSNLDGVIDGIRLALGLETDFASPANAGEVGRTSARPGGGNARPRCSTSPHPAPSAPTSPAPRGRQGNE